MSSGQRANVRARAYQEDRQERARWAAPATSIDAHVWPSVPEGRGICDAWVREVPPLDSAEQAVAVLEAHTSWYPPGRIRAVRKVVRTTVETYTAELRA